MAFSKSSCLVIIIVAIVVAIEVPLAMGISYTNVGQSIGNTSIDGTA